MPACYYATFYPVYGTSRKRLFFVGRGINRAENPLYDSVVVHFEVLLYAMDVSGILIHKDNDVDDLSSVHS